jgi:hypothetical protein
MFPDFRFVLGAILAITLLAVAGLGLVTSVQLMREARMAPLEDPRRLAFAGRADWNQFYDPESGRRFEELAGKAEGPVARARLEPSAEPSAAVSSGSAPAGPDQRTASIPPPRIEAVTVPEIAPVTADDKAPDTTLDADPPPLAETLATVRIAVPPAERIASLPVTLPSPDRAEETRLPPQEAAQPQAADVAPDAAPPTPRARPKPHFRRRIARARVRPVAPASPQTGFPTSYAPSSWPGSDNQFAGPTTTRRNTGKLFGTLSNRP